MNDKQIDRLLNRLENECNNELQLIESFDLCYFETDYLEEIYANWKARRKILVTEYNRLLLLAALSPIWLIIGLIGTYFHITVLSYFTYFFPISLAIFIYGMFRSYQEFGGLKHYDSLGDSVRQELIRRRDPLQYNYNYEV